MQRTGKNSALEILRTSTPTSSAGLEDIMKSFTGHGDALTAPRRAPAGTRFITTAFAALVIIAGLDTIFPSLKHQFIPESGAQPREGTSYTARPFKWSQVCMEHS
jgi:hypothetical protein